MLSCSNDPLNPHQLPHNLQSKGPIGHIDGQAKRFLRETMNSDERNIMAYEPVTGRVLILHLVHLDLREMGQWFVRD